MDMPEKAKKPSLAIWMYAFALHAAIGTLLLLVSIPSFYLNHALAIQARVQNITNFVEPGRAPTPFSFNAMMYLGIGHISYAFLAAVIFLGGNLIFPKLLIVIKPAAMLQSLLCILTTVVVESNVSHYHEYQLFRFHKLREASEALAPSDSNLPHNLTTFNHAGMIIAAGALSLAILSTVALATASNDADPAPVLMLTFPIVLLGASLGGTIIFATSQLNLIIFGSAWAIASAALDFLGGLKSFIGAQWGSIVLAIVQILIGGFGIVTAYLAFEWLASGRANDGKLLSEIAVLSKTERTIYKYYFILGEFGSYLTLTLVLGIVIFLLCLVAAGYSLYYGNQQVLRQRDAAALNDTDTKKKTEPGSAGLSKRTESSKSKTSEGPPVHTKTTLTTISIESTNDKKSSNKSKDSLPVVP